MEESDHVALGLRLALLESLTHGDTPPTNPEPPSLSSTLVLRSSHAHSRFLQSIDNYKPIVQFVDEYKDNQAYLQPANITGSSVPHINEQTSTSIGNGTVQEEGKPEERLVSLLDTRSVISLLLESEGDLRQLDRDLRMCEHHYERGTAGAGKLAEYEPLAPRLSALREQATASSQQEAEIEKQVLQLMDTYSTQIDTMSKLFINWDQVLTQTEDALTRLERAQRKG